MASQVTTINRRLGSNIRAAREQAGLTQRQLGALVNDTDGNVVSRWERGTHRPTDDNLAALAHALRRDIGWFYAEQAA